MESWETKRFKEAIDPSLEDMGDVSDFEQPGFSFDEGLRLCEEYGKPIHITYFQTFEEAVNSNDPELWASFENQKEIDILMQFYRSHSFKSMKYVGGSGAGSEVYEIPEGFKYILLCVLDSDPIHLLYNDLRLSKIIDTRS